MKLCLQTLCAVTACVPFSVITHLDDPAASAAIQNQTKPKSKHKRNPTAGWYSDSQLSR